MRRLEKKQQWNIKSNIIVLAQTKYPSDFNSIMKTFWGNILPHLCEKPGLFTSSLRESVKAMGRERGAIEEEEEGKMEREDRKREGGGGGGDRPLESQPLSLGARSNQPL